MVTRRRSPRGRRGSVRQKVTWNNHALTFTLATSGVLVFANLTPKPLSIGDDAHGTAVSKRVIMNFSARQVGPASDVTQQFGIALYIQTLQAITQLEILQPLSAQNVDQDWYYWTARSTFRETSDNLDSLNWDVDIKTQRRLRSGYGMILVAEPVAANTSNIIITASVRQLWAISN